MTWTAYKISFRLLSPMHIGWHKLGNLQQTRPYVTGRSLWGALTARLTREAGNSNYHEIGEQVDDQLAFTYFYPSMEPSKVDLWPWPDDQWDKFTWTFLGSYASTALENARNAEAGSLHETEYIAPYTREGQQVYLVGYIFEKDTCNLNWQSALGKLQFGGERGYGWGRVHAKDGYKKINDNNCFDYDVLLDSDRPKLKALGNLHMLAHTRADIDNVGNRGVAIEPLIGRETKEVSGFGKNHSQAEICWIPGGSVNDGETFHIQQKGVWERLL